MSDSYITVSGIVKTYRWGKIKALDGVSFSVRKGEMFGLIGPNGAGKTTLMGCMLGLLKPNKGSVTVGSMTPNDLRIKEGLGFLPERPDFSRWMSVMQFLHYHHKLAKQPQDTARSDINAVLDLVGLEKNVQSRKVRELSRGMLQRLGLAQALIGKPTLCFLDEPTSGMDPLGITRVREILLDLKKRGVTIILNSHHLDEVEKTCDRVAFIRHGKIKTVRDLSESEGSTDIFTVRWKNSVNSTEKKNVIAIAQKLNLSIGNIDDTFAEFPLSGDDAARDLIKALVDGNVPVTQASYSKESLEQLFDETESDHGGAL